MIRATAVGTLSVEESTARGRLIQDVVHILNEARARWISGRSPIKKSLTLGASFEPDLVAIRGDFTFAIECRLSIREPWARERFEQLNKRGGSFHEYDELWLVCYRRATRQRDDLSNLLPRLRVMDLNQLREHLRLAMHRKLPEKPPKKRKARTKIGKAVEANEKDIQVRLAALMLQIQDAIDRLRHERPNSSEGIAAVRTKLSEYESMLAQLESIRTAVAEYTKGKEKEKVVIERVRTFKDTIQSWWMKGHERICNTAADSAIFVGSAGLLHGINADSSVALAIVGALIGGDSVAKCLKALPRKLFSS